MRLTSRLLFTVLVVILLQNQILGWWENGHMLVAQIAKLELLKNNPKVYDRVNELIQALNPLCEDIDYDFVESAVWADDIKDKAMDFWEPWHYYNLPINPTGDFLVQNPQANLSNSINCLNRSKMELQNDNGVITLQKCIFIRFVLHVVGDMHQPLHNANMYNASFDVSGDLGGNRESIIDLLGRTVVFHAYWDQGAQYLQGPGENFITRPLNDTGKQYLEDWGKNLTQSYPRSFFGDRLGGIDFQKWSNESYIYARDNAYPLIYTQNYVTSLYQSQAQEIVRQQITIGGYRLADYLVSLYSNYNPPTQKSQKQVEIEQI